MVITLYFYTFMNKIMINYILSRHIHERFAYYVTTTKGVLLCVILVAGLPYTSCIKIATKINVIEAIVVGTKTI